MCPLCWAALIAQVVFFVSLGVLLVLVSDLRFGLPLGIYTLILAYGNYKLGWGVPNELLYAALVILALRGVLILIYQDRHWVRSVAARVAGLAIRLLRPPMEWAKARGLYSPRNHDESKPSLYTRTLQSFQASRANRVLAKLAS